MQTPFSRVERQELLDRYFAEHEQWLDLDFRSVTSAGSPETPVSQEKDRLAASLAGLLDQYRRNLPVLPVSRCPFTQQVLYHSLDPYGIDGPWWNYTAPVRPIDYVMPQFHSLTGALRLSEPVEKAPFLCVPGPGVPYVVPEILSDDNIRAVLSSLLVGNHTGYLIAYFTDDPTVRVPRMNCWGANRWQVLDRRGTFMWGEFSPPASQFDFNIGTWMEKGKLLWIQPDDTALTLHRGTKNCPFLACTGTKTIQRIRNGKLMTTQEKEGT